MSLARLIAETIGKPVPPEIRVVADGARARHRGVAAVLAYGSCLRGIATTESLIDLYVLTDDLSGVSRNAVSRMACGLVPPNVYYIECDVAEQRYRAKYAVLPLPLFARWMTAANPYFWARFSQPSALVYCANEKTRSETIAALAHAVETAFGNARALSSASDPLDVWTAGFAATYATELRAETAARADSIVAANTGYYRAAAESMSGTAPIAANWPLRRVTGKLWSAARLVKAAFTFTGGADYIAWKIERHSGQKITLTDWQRRHPVMAGLLLLPRLLKRGAVR